MASEVLLPCPECGRMPRLIRRCQQARNILWPLPILWFKPIGECKCLIVCDCGNVMTSPTRANDRELSEERTKLIKRWNRYAIVPEYWHN